MTWRRGSGRAVGSVGVDGGTSVDSGVTPGSERQSARPLFLPPPDCQMLEFRVFFPLLSMTYLWFACFTATVACWGFNQREKKKRTFPLLNSQSADEWVTPQWQIRSVWARTFDTIWSSLHHRQRQTLTAVCFFKISTSELVLVSENTALHSNKRDKAATVNFTVNFITIFAEREQTTDKNEIRKRDTTVTMMMAMKTVSVWICRLRSSFSICVPDS